jgi:hypothetical protein
LIALTDGKLSAFTTEIDQLAVNRLLKRSVFCLYVILVVFISFDGLRDSTIFFSVLSYLREGTVLLLFVLSLGPRARLTKSLLNLGLFALGVCYFYGLLVTLSPYYQHLRSISEPAVVLYRHVQFLMLIPVFSHCRRLSGKSPKFYLGMLVFFQLIYTVITPLIYYFPPSIMRDGYEWWGRLGVGYPTMDAQTYCFALVAVICVLDFKKMQLNLVVGLLVLGILMQVTGTGLVTLMFLLMYIVVCERLVLKRLLPSIGIMMAFLTAIFWNFYGLLEKPIQLALQKMSDIANLGSGVSTDIRKEQLEQLLHLGAGDYFRRLFGMGVNVYVENQYSFFLAAFGVAGLCIFIFFLITLFLHGMANAGKDNRALMLAAIVFSLSSYTLVSFYLYPNYALLALFIAHNLSQSSGVGKASYVRS